MPPIGLLLAAGVVALIALAVRKTLRAMRERKQRERQFPAQPWMWRQDWADRTVRDSEAVATGFLWFFGIVWTLISLPMLFVVKGEGAMRPQLWFVALFPIVGAGVLAVAAYMTLRRFKYGVSVCRLDRVPVPIGGELRAEVDARVRELPPAGFQVRLTCVNRIITGSGKSSSTRETILWQEEQSVGSGMAMPGPEGIRVPLRFAIPADASPSDDTNPRDAVIWRLLVQADVPGIDYRSHFEVPVFRTEEVPAGSTAFSHGKPVTPWTPPPSIAFGLSRTGGEEITIGSSSGFGDWIAYLFFFAVWFGSLEAVRRFGAPIWAIVIFHAIGLVVVLAAADLLLRRTTISADRTTLHVRHSWLGLPRTHDVPASEIDSIHPRVGRSTGNRAYYDIDARLRDGKTVLIAKNLRGRQDGEGLAARISRAIGRQASL